MKATAINDVIVQLTATLDSALAYPVFDGPPNPLPQRTGDRYLCLGAEDIEDPSTATTAASMNAEIHGLGQISRLEELHIACVAVGKAKSIAEARAIAIQVVDEVSANLPIQPTPECFGVHVSEVSSVRSQNKVGGAVVQILFTISASARLT